MRPILPFPQQLGLLPLALLALGGAASAGCEHEDPPVTDSVTTVTSGAGGAGGGGECALETEGPGRMVAGPCKVTRVDTRTSCAAYSIETTTFDAEEREIEYVALGHCTDRSVLLGECSHYADELEVIRERRTTYDADGTIARLEVSPSSVDFPYPFGRTLPELGAVDYEYEDGRLARAVTDTGFEGTFVYDARGLLQRVDSVALATMEPAFVVAYAYDARGREVTQEIRDPRRDPPADNTNYQTSYDATGLVAEIHGKAIDWSSTRSYEHELATGKLEREVYWESSPGPTTSTEVDYWYRDDGSLASSRAVHQWIGSDGSTVPDIVVETVFDDDGNPLTAKIVADDTTFAAVTYDYGCWL